MLHVLLSKKRGKQGEATFRADERSLKGSSWPLAVGKNMESACSSWQFPCDWINLASSTKKVYNHNLRCLRIKREVEKKSRASNGFPSLFQAVLSKPQGPGRPGIAGYHQLHAFMLVLSGRQVCERTCHSAGARCSMSYCREAQGHLAGSKMGETIFQGTPHKNTKEANLLFTYAFYTFGHVKWASCASSHQASKIVGG